MAQKRYMWSTDLALATLQTLVELIIGHFLSTSPIMPNLGSLCHPHGAHEVSPHCAGDVHLDWSTLYQVTAQPVDLTNT